MHTVNFALVYGSHTLRPSSLETTQRLIINLRNHARIRIKRTPIPHNLTFQARREKRIEHA